MTITTNETVLKVAYTKKWAVTMTKVRIRQAVKKTPFPYWHLLTFNGAGGNEATGVVDLIAIRKDHSTPRDGMKRGDAFELILIQVKGGSARKPTLEDGVRLRAVSLLHNAQAVLLASWKKGGSAEFFTLSPQPKTDKEKTEDEWTPVSDMEQFFGKRRPMKVPLPI